MEQTILNALVQFGIAAPLLLFMWFRQKRSDAQIDTKDAQIEKANDALRELSKGVIQTLTEVKVKMDGQDGRLTSIDSRLNDLSRGRP